MSVIKNIQIMRTETYSKIYELLDKNNNPIDLSNFQYANGEIKKSSTSSTLVGYFDITFLEPKTNGHLLIVLPKERLANTYPGKYQYDIFLKSNEERYLVCSGVAELAGNVTGL